VRRLGKALSTPTAVARQALWAGILATLAANLLSAPTAVADSPLRLGIVYGMAAWPAVVLALAAELLWRMPPKIKQSWVLAIVAYAGMAIIAGVAGYVSYGHQVTLAEYAGQTGWTPRLFPALSDALMLMAGAILSYKPRSTTRTRTSSTRRKAPSKAAERPVEAPAASNGHSTIKTLAPAA
jgi:hypothetical protein